MHGRRPVEIIRRELSILMLALMARWLSVALVGHHPWTEIGRSPSHLITLNLGQQLWAAHLDHLHEETLHLRRVHLSYIVKMGNHRGWHHLSGRSPLLIALSLVLSGLIILLLALTWVIVITRELRFRLVLVLLPVLVLFRWHRILIRLS
jgi:hypothetical protein